MAAASGASPCGGTISTGPDRRAHRPGARRRTSRSPCAGARRAARSSPSRCSCAARPTACWRSRTARSATFTDLDVRLAASFGGQVALAIENARLRDEIGQAAAATERSRLARDLHDSVTQSLFAASLKAEAIRRRWRPTSDEARDNVEDVERLARGALAEMRTLLMEMRPDALAEASLATLLEQLAAATEGGSRVTVHLEVRGSAPAAARTSASRCSASPRRPSRT